MKNLLILTLLIASFDCLFAQDLSPAEEKLYKQISAFPQEKIHIHTDKSTYVSGEKIWYRAYLVDALLHVPKSLSRYVYVELVNSAAETILRNKIRPSPLDSAFHNSIDLPEDLPEGAYLIRAYTNFMRTKADYFFEKKIYVADPQSSKFRIKTDFRFDDKNVKLKLAVRDYEDNPIEVENLSLGTDAGKAGKYKAENDFTIKKIAGNQQSVYVEFDKDGRKFKKYIPIPDDDFDVSFFPEGGYLVDDIHCRIGFKALKSSGLPENISGEIFDGENNNIGSFESSHDGMGSFYINPGHGKSYYAECKTSDNKTKRFTLPSSRSDVCVLKIMQNKTRVYISSTKGKDFQNQPLSLLVHLRGIPIYSGEMPASNVLSIEKATLPSGLIQILLIDKDMNTLSERLFFNLNNKELPVNELNVDKPDYERRELVSAKIKVSDEEGFPLDGNFSVSVTDNRDVPPDSSFTIYSSLLLSSEIKGYIESPAYYIENPIDADHLMLTQGWRRYNIPAALKDTLEKPLHYLEAGQEISGTVKRVLGSKVNENNNVTMFSSAGYFDMTMSDANGRYRFNGFEFPDSTTFIVQALNKRGGTYVELLVDEESFPPTRSFAAPAVEIDSLFKKYVEKSDLKYSDEYGMRVTVLDAAVVTGQKNLPPDGKKSIYSSAFNTVVTSEDFKHASDLLHALMIIPGVTVVGNNVTIRGSSTPPLFVIDDVIWEDFNIDGINVYDIDRIEVMKGAEAAIFGSRGAGGVIIISTKTGVVNTNVIRFNIKTIVPKGYKKEVEFYSPRYERPASGIDRRTTIYWNPNIELSEGNAEFDFYTADANTSYSVVIEGITKDGRIIRTTKNISRQK
ncbi:MAG: TonB-dependent receptor plug domain-containing protein [Prevotellaceae bacterium]|jgi:TonB-dependent SusC/RagA subfamily outer membrane receptor|nr:TonB-dependent receptor plug domain-containing protein [Prevotellaceae bacterium]